MGPNFDNGVLHSGESILDVMDFSRLKNWAVYFFVCVCCMYVCSVCLYVCMYACIILTIYAYYLFVYFIIITDIG